MLSIDIKSKHKTLGTVIHALWLGQELKSCFLAAFLGVGVWLHFPHPWSAAGWLDLVATDPLHSYQNHIGGTRQRFTCTALCFLISGSFARHSRKPDSFFFPPSLSLRIIPEWWVQSLMLSAWIILPTWQHQQTWGEVGIMHGLCKVDLRDGAWKISCVLFSFPRKQSDDLSWLVICPFFSATCRFRSFEKLQQNSTSIFLLNLNHYHNI